MSGHSEACRSRRLARPPAKARIALAPRWVSEVAKSADKPTLFVAVLCRPQDVVLRSSVRTGWASDGRMQGGDSDAKSRWRYGFVIGWSGLSDAEQQHLLLEADRFSDIIAIDVVDAYTNLTLKVCHLLHLAVQIQSEYFVRLNGNERLQVGRLVELLHKDLQHEKLYPNGFVWGQRGCMLPHVFEELSCGTTSLKDWPLLVDGLSSSVSTGIMAGKQEGPGEHGNCTSDFGRLPLAFALGRGCFHGHAGNSCRCTDPGYSH